MTEPVSSLQQSLAALNSEQQWRRVGITQAFDRLLVEAAARNPGPVLGVREAAGRTLTAGAARFYEMSFPQLLRDLIKRNVLIEKGGNVSLAPAFIERLQQVLASQATGQSHVEPTPGVTMEDLQTLADQRAEREKSSRSTRPARKEAGEKAEKPKKEKAAKGTTPRKRAGTAPEGEPAPPAAPKAPAPPPTPHRSPVSALFTSLRINKLLDVLDTGSLNPEQLAERLDMPKRDLERFLTVSESIGITRRNGPLVELHWHGRELARTTTADRRVKVTDAVKSLRDRAAELDA